MAMKPPTWPELVKILISIGSAVALTIGWMYGNFTPAREHGATADRVTKLETQNGEITKAVQALSARMEGVAQILPRIEKGQERLDAKLERISERLAQAMHGGG